MRQAPARLHLHENTGAAWVSLPDETGLMWCSDMHAGAFNLLQARNGVCQFCFQRVLIARTFHELTDSEAAIFVAERT